MVLSNAIPGVRCVRCLGRITEAENEWSRRLQTKLRPGESFRPPKVCQECVLATILSWPDTDAPE